MRDISASETSKIIKRTLHDAFPTVPFSVRLKTYSGGCSIDARWTDGPTSKQVDAILNRFEGKGFDGMTDCSFYCGERLYKGERVDFHSGYVSGNRQLSASLLRIVAARVATECGVPAPVINARGYVESCDYARVPYQWHSHWHGEKPLTMCDFLSSRPILARDSHEGEYLSRLVDKLAQWLSLKPEALLVDLPEYIDIEEKASTGRAAFEEPMSKFEGHEAFLKLIQ